MITVDMLWWHRHGVPEGDSAGTTVWLPGQVPGVVLRSAFDARAGEDLWEIIPGPGGPLVTLPASEVEVRYPERCGWCGTGIRPARGPDWQAQLDETWLDRDNGTDCEQPHQPHDPAEEW